ncbi:MAG: hypothetical protein SFV51_23525 [Bryobacteraceae bacterium]|nr:hypothetical protein [Bryobacteraceae bacterium]
MADAFKFQYATKIICTSHIPGTSQTSDAVLPGVYQTAVNIHNPGRRAVKIRKKIAVPGIVSDFFGEELGADGATRFTCRQIQDFGITFIHGAEGFLVIESTGSLDVVAVYTASPRGGEVSSIDVEHVPERKLGR